MTPTGVYSRLSLFFCGRFTPAYGRFLLSFCLWHLGTGDGGLRVIG